MRTPRQVRSCCMRWRWRAGWTRATAILRTRRRRSSFLERARLRSRARCGSRRGGYYNDLFIDITDVVDKKLAALDCLVSQGYGGAYARKRIETSDGAFGMAGGVAYAEGFIKLNAETHDHLPVTERALAAARASDHELIEERSYRIRVD